MGLTAMVYTNVQRLDDKYQKEIIIHDMDTGEISFRDDSVFDVGRLIAIKVFLGNLAMIGFLRESFNGGERVLGKCTIIKNILNCDGDIKITRTDVTKLHDEIKRCNSVELSGEEREFITKMQSIVAVAMQENNGIHVIN